MGTSPPSVSGEISRVPALAGQPAPVQQVPAARRRRWSRESPGPQTPHRPMTHPSADVPFGHLGIFISERRQDVPNFAGRLYDRLAAHFGRDRVFMDVDTIDLGLDFADVIDESLARCGVMIVVIGEAGSPSPTRRASPAWRIPTTTYASRSRGRSESATRVIPVVVEGAVTPKRAGSPQRSRHCRGATASRWRTRASPPMCRDLSPPSTGSSPSRAAGARDRMRAWRPGRQRDRTRNWASATCARPSAGSS